MGRFLTLIDSVSTEDKVTGICGNHRQRETGRFLSYWATYLEADSFVTYFGVIRDGQNLLALPEGTTSFELIEMTADEAARKHLCDFIDATMFGEGTPPTPSWTDYGPYK